MTTGAEFWPDEPASTRVYLAEEWYNGLFPSNTTFACDHLRNHGFQYLEFTDKFKRNRVIALYQKQYAMDEEIGRAYHNEIANRLINIGLARIRHELQDPAVQWAKLQRAIFVEVYNQGKPEHLRLKE